MKTRSHYEISTTKSLCYSTRLWFTLLCKDAGNETARSWCSSGIDRLVGELSYRLKYTPSSPSQYFIHLIVPLRRSGTRYVYAGVGIVRHKCINDDQTGAWNGLPTWFLFRHEPAASSSFDLVETSTPCIVWSHSIIWFTLCTLILSRCS